MNKMERRYSLDSVCEWFAHPEMTFRDMNVPIDPAKQFSVLVVDIGIPENEPILSQRLMDRISDCVPGCRRIMWDDDSHIAVLCPDTTDDEVSHVNEIAALTVAIVKPGSNNAVVSYTYQPCISSGEQ